MRCCGLLSVQSVTEQANPLAGFSLQPLGSIQWRTNELGEYTYLHLKWLLWERPLPQVDWRVLGFDSQVNTDLQATLVPARDG